MGARRDRMASARARSGYTDSELLEAAAALAGRREYSLADEWRQAWAIRCVDWPNETGREVDVGGVVQS